MMSLSDHANQRLRLKWCLPADPRCWQWVIPPGRLSSLPVFLQSGSGLSGDHIVVIPPLTLQEASCQCSLSRIEGELDEKLLTPVLGTHPVAAIRQGELFSHCQSDVPPFGASILFRLSFPPPPAAKKWRRIGDRAHNCSVPRGSRRRIDQQPFRTLCISAYPCACPISFPLLSPARGSRVRMQANRANERLHRWFQTPGVLGCPAGPRTIRRVTHARF